MAKWFMLFMPIIIPFYKSNDLTTTDIFVLHAVYSVAITLLEIHSGYFADIWGRKNALVLGVILGVAGYGIYSFSFSFEGFLIAELVLGVGQSFISGSDSAMLYDTLAASGRKDEYLKYEGRVMSIGNFAEGIAGVLSSFLFIAAARYPIYGQTLIALFGIPAALTLVEPQRESLVNKTFRNSLNIVKYALWENSKLKWAILLSSAVGCATLTMAWFAQFYFLHVEVPIKWFGSLWTVLNLGVAVAAFAAYKVKQHIGIKYIVTGFVLFVSLGYIGISFVDSYYGLIILFGFYVVRGIATPVLKDYINELTSSEIRATVLSLRTFIIRIGFSILGPFYGWYADFYSLPQALMLAGIVFFSFGVVALLMYLKKYNQNAMSFKNT